MINVTQEPFYQDRLDYQDKPLNFHGLYRKNGIVQVDSIDSEGCGDILRTLAYSKKLQSILGEKIGITFFCKDYAYDFLISVIRQVKFLDDFAEMNIEILPCLLDKSDYSAKWIRHQRAWSMLNWMEYPDLDLKRTPQDGGYVAIWDSIENIDYPSRWKDPVHPASMWELAKTVNQDIKRVSYRMSMDYVFETIANASFCIGYEGLGNVIAYNYKKPMIIFSESSIISRATSGPWSRIFTRIDSKLINNIDTIIDEQRAMINESEKTRQD